MKFIRLVGLRKKQKPTDRRIENRAILNKAHKLTDQSTVSSTVLKHSNQTTFNYTMHN